MKIYLHGKHTTKEERKRGMTQYKKRRYSINDQYL